MTDEVRQEDREAAVFRKRGSVEAIRWFKLGDHPAVIRRERWPEPRDTHWTYWLGPLTGGFPVEVGDWIITDQSGRHSRKSPEDFDRAYELDDAAPLRTRIAELEGALVAEREDSLWYAYASGRVRDGQWSHLGMSEGEWLARECGFNGSDRHFDDEAVRAAIPKAARNVLATLNGEKKDG